MSTTAFKQDILSASIELTIFFCQLLIHVIVNLVTHSAKAKRLKNGPSSLVAVKIAFAYA